jgi:hypothetical protein
MAPFAWHQRDRRAVATERLVAVSQPFGVPPGHHGRARQCGEPRVNELGVRHYIIGISFAQRSSSGRILSAFSDSRLTTTRATPMSR